MLNSDGAEVCVSVAFVVDAREEVCVQDVRETGSWPCWSGQLWLVALSLFIPPPSHPPPTSSRALLSNTWEQLYLFFSLVF